MRQTRTLAFSRITPFLPDDLANLEATLRQLPFTEERGFGFQTVTRNDHILSARLLLRQTTTLAQRQPESNTLFETEAFFYHDITFSIESPYKLLSVTGPLYQAPKVRQALRTVLLSGTRITPVTLVPAHILDGLLSNGADVAILKLSVLNFQHQPDIRGRYDIEAIPLEVGQHIMAEYPRNVQRASLRVTLRGWPVFVLHILQQGGLRLQAEAGDLPDILAFLKQLAFSAGN